MPQQRLQVDSPTGPARLATPASPVDTFAPDTASAQKLDQLAQGLSTLSPALGRLSDTLAERQAASDQQAGAQKARELAASAKSFKEAVDAGRLLPSQSPWFMAGLREQFGRLAADHQAADFTVAMAKDPNMQSTTNPEDFDKFYSQFSQQWSQQNLGDSDTQDPHFIKGFGARSDAYLVDARQQFSSQLAGRVVRVAGDQQFSEALNSILTELGRGTSQEAIGQSLTQLNDEAVARGVDGTLVNQMTSEAIIQAAKRLGDQNVLGLLDQVHSGPALATGTRATLGTTRFGADARDKAIDDIGAENQARANRQYQIEERGKAQAVDAIFTQATQALEAADDPHNADLSTYRAQLETVAPEKVPMLFQMQDAWNSHELKDDPTVVASLFRRIYTQDPGEAPTSIEDASAVLADRKMSIPTYREMVNDIQQRQEHGSPIDRDPLLKQGQQQVKSMFVSEFGFDTPDMRRRAEEAVDEFTMRYIRWRTGPGKDATEEQARTWIHDARTSVFASKSSASDLRDFKKIPQANLGPSVPDASKQLVTDPSNIRLVQQEFDEIVSRKRSQFSSSAIQVLNYAGIRPTAADVKEFLQNQQRFIPTFVPDSTSH